MKMNRIKLGALMIFCMLLAASIIPFSTAAFSVNAPHLKDKDVSTKTKESADSVKTGERVFPQGDGKTEYWAVLISGADEIDHWAYVMQSVLLRYPNWKRSHIYVIRPTPGDIEERDTIKKAIELIGQISDSDDIVFFFLSAHAGYCPDSYPIDEPDGRDGCGLIMLSAYNTYTDDEIGKYFRNLAERPRIAALFETCASSEMVDGSADPGSVEGMEVFGSAKGEEVGGTEVIMFFTILCDPTVRDELDKDKDGWISFEEYCEYRYSGIAPPPQNSSIDEFFADSCPGEIELFNLSGKRRDIAKDKLPNFLINTHQKLINTRKFLQILINFYMRIHQRYSNW